MIKDLKSIGILFAVVLATSLPFVRRAYFVDDFYFVTMAKGILQNPWRPYDFKSDDAGIGNVGWERGQRPRMVNPPLFHYFLAGVITLVGDAPWKLRTASLLFSLVAVASMYFLGKRFVSDPLPPALLMAVCPAYWLTSYSLLIDSALLAFMLAALLAFFIGLEKKHIGWILFSGMLMGLAVLTKYFGVIVIALAFTWQMLDARRRSWKPGYLAYVVFFFIQALWAVWNVSTYGQSHFLAALPRGMNSPSITAWAQKSLVLGSFIGGSVIFVMASPAMLWRVSKRGWPALSVLMECSLVSFVHARADLIRCSPCSWHFSSAEQLAYLVVMGPSASSCADKNQLFLNSLGFDRHGGVDRGDALDGGTLSALHSAGDVLDLCAAD